MLNNRYKIRQKLGQGGFGETFLAEDTHMPSGRTCVVKQLNPDAQNRQFYSIAVQRFQEEAGILEKLGENHDQIPKLYDYFEEEGHFYVVQEWIEGQTLAEWVRVHGAMEQEAVEKILFDLLTVLEYIHSNKVIHRDIKPDNIILRDRDNKPVVIDFGSVKQILKTSVNTSGSVTCSIMMGSGVFMAPEQASHRISYSSDLYSLGMTAIYLLTGKLPSQLESDPHSSQFLWHNLLPSLKPNLAAAIDKITQFDPSNRYRTATEVLKALQSIRSAPASQRAGVSSYQGPTLIGDPSVAGQSKNRRRSTIVIASTFVAFLLAGVAGAYTLGVAKAERQAYEDLVEICNQDKYKECQDAASDFSQNSKFSEDVENLLDRSKLRHAEKLASEEQYEEAMTLAKKISSNSDTYPEVQGMIDAWSILDNANKLALAGNPKAAINKVMEIPSDSDAALDAWNKIAQWSDVSLEETMNTEAKLQSKRKRDRHATTINTKFGTSTISRNWNSWPEYQLPSQEDIKSDPSWGDPWRESYEIVSQKMTLGFIYACRSKEILQIEVFFNPSVELPLMQAKLNHMLDGTAGEEINRGLQQVYLGEASSHKFNNGRFKGSIERDSQDQLLIAVRNSNK